MLNQVVKPLKDVKLFALGQKAGLEKEVRQLEKDGNAKQ